MAEFLKDSQVNTAIEDLIDKADKYIWLISPYIKLNERIKDRLKIKKGEPDLEIVMIFGKNEYDTSKSLSKEDFDFLKNFPNITIGYEKRLHAKYYASEDYSIITSMNLHEFSLNNNIEVAIKLKTKNWLQISGDSADAECYNYFLDIVENCDVIYRNEPVYKTGLLGLTTSYVNSEVTKNESDNFFKKKENFQGKKYKELKRDFPKASESINGFCIRTGKPIPFNIKQPLSDEAFKSWSRYKDEKFKEKYCHFSGEPTNGETCFAKPILSRNWSKAKERHKF